MTMDKELIMQKVEEIANQLFQNIDQMEGQPDNYVYTYRLTSIDVLEFLLAIESEFGFEFDDADLTEQTLMDKNRLVEIITSVAGERLVR